jgi:hypothetical protein
MVTFWANIGEKEYYEKQFATLRSFEEVDSIEESNVMSEEDDIAEQKQSEFAMKISNYANMILLALKVVLSRFILIPFLTFI